MAKLSRPRFGSLQFWPRKRASKVLPSVNWKSIKGSGILGFIAYKVGMATAVAKDLTDKSMTQGKKVFFPVTILEVPKMKVFAIRFYLQGKVIKDVIVSNDKELKRKLKLPKETKKLENEIPSKYDDVRLIIYSLVNQTTIKKTPDMIEIAIGAPDIQKKLEIAKSLVGKEISFKDFQDSSLIDVRGLTKGKGICGPVKRFGISLKQHKTEKGIRRPGSLGPWHPAHVTFRVAMAGQLGYFSRVHYNLKTLTFGSISEKNINPSQGFKNYGLIKTDFVILRGSVQGPPKRQLLLTPSLRPSKSLSKKKYEFQELII